MQKPALRSCMQLVVVNVLCVVCAYFLAVAACRWFIVHVFKLLLYVDCCSIKLQCHC